MLLINCLTMTSFCTVVALITFTIHLCAQWMLLLPWCISSYIIFISFMRFVTNNLVARTHSYMMDSLCALTIVFPSVVCVCSSCMYTTPATHWSTWIAQCLQLRPTTSLSTTSVSMVMRITIRGRIFPKGGEMMRRILWSSPCTLQLLPKPQEDIWRDLEHTPLDTRWTRSSPNRHFPHVRHGYYLKHMCYAWPGTKRKAMEKLGALDKTARM